MHFRSVACVWLGAFSWQSRDKFPVVMVGLSRSEQEPNVMLRSFFMFCILCLRFLVQNTFKESKLVFISSLRGVRWYYSSPVFQTQSIKKLNCIIM